MRARRAPLKLNLPDCCLTPREELNYKLFMRRHKMKMKKKCKITKLKGRWK